MQALLNPVPVTGQTILNQGDLLLAGHWPSALVWKLPMTYAVPFTHSKEEPWKSSE